MQPTIVEISPSADVVKEELFGPVLYVMKFQVALSKLCNFSLVAVKTFSMSKEFLILNSNIFADSEGSNRYKQLCTSRSK